MKLLIVADGRSPITLNWIQYLVENGHIVNLVSTYPCILDDPRVSLSIIPVAFSQFVQKKNQKEGELFQNKSHQFQKFIIKSAASPKLRTILRQWFGPLTISKAAKKLRQYINQVQPDLVHAMRIPYEGMLAAEINSSTPLIVSVWGNDFTLHAKANPWMRKRTRKAIMRADAIHTDCWRDLRLAHEWGFSPRKPSIVLPSSGGVQMDVFYPPSKDESLRNIPGGEGKSFTVINPRGFRAYVRNDIFFSAIPLVIDRLPGTRFICPGMETENQAHQWISDLMISDVVDLLPFQSPKQLANLFRKAQVTVSPTVHDGTPNSLLEGMACGCFPVVGDLESIREWITPELNGLLINPTNVHELADAIIKAITQPELRARAADYNIQLISERAEYQIVMSDAVSFYEQVFKAQTGKSL